jgi:hypothetical protein
MEQNAGGNCFTAMMLPKQANVMDKLGVPDGPLQQGLKGELERSQAKEMRTMRNMQGGILPIDKSKFDSTLATFLEKSGKKMAQSDLQQNIDGCMFTLWDLHAQVLQHGPFGIVSRWQFSEQQFD